MSARTTPAPAMTDLFGEIDVTIDDVALWLRVVARIEPAVSPRLAAYYTQWWNVPDKIKHAKRSGNWPPQ